MSFSPFLDMAKQAHNVKKTETALPISSQLAVVSPLVVGDDLAIRSSLTSPVGYDRELVRLLAQHTQFDQNGQYVQYNTNEFSDITSNIDKVSLLWALYKSTYETLATQRTISCPNETCPTNSRQKGSPELKIDIHLDELIHDDTYHLWDAVDEEGNVIPFFDYSYPITIEYGGFKYVFYGRIPSVTQNNQLLGMISNDILQNNLEKTGVMFSRDQQIVLITKGIHIIPEDGGEGVYSENIQELLIACEQHVPYTVSEKYLKEYGEKFDQYIPNFYKEVKCSSCGHEFQYKVDLEVEFFRRSLFGAGESI